MSNRICASTSCRSVGLPEGESKARLGPLTDCQLVCLVVKSSKEIAKDTSAQNKHKDQEEMAASNPRSQPSETQAQLEGLFRRRCILRFTPSSKRCRTVQRSGSIVLHEPHKQLAEQVLRHLFSAFLQHSHRQRLREHCEDPSTQL